MVKLESSIIELFNRYIRLNAVKDCIDNLKWAMASSESSGISAHVADDLECYRADIISRIEEVRKQVNEKAGVWNEQ